MKKIIPDIVHFPTDAESNPFFCALASVLLPALGYTEHTPFYCGQKGSFCIDCGNCKDKSTLSKHHLQLYHDYQTITGVGLGWRWPEAHRTDYQTVTDGGPGWDWPDDFIRYIMGAAGLAWQRLNRHDALFDEIKASVDAGMPVLLKLGGGPDWHVVTGYDDDRTLYGLDTHTHYDTTVRPAVAPDGYTEDGLFILSDWLTPFSTGIVVTGRCEPTIKLAHMLAKMIETLERPEHVALEKEVMHRIGRINPDNALETAQWLNGIAGFPIEARWHAADSSLNRMTDNEAVRMKLHGVTRQYVFDNDLDATHGTCWKIWGQLGVGPDTDYKVTSKAAPLVQTPESQAELKRLFGIVFQNDRIVLSLLREAFNILAAESLG